MDDIEWSVTNEGQLLDAMVGHKPVGVNKYFQMAFICEKLCNNLNKDINPAKIWAHLKTMYNLEALDETETIPFPNNEKEFALPDEEFASFIDEKKDEDKKLTQKGRETPKNTKEVKKEKDEKTPARNIKETPRRDSKDIVKDNKPVIAKTEMKKDLEKSKPSNNKSNKSINSTPKDDSKLNKNKTDETPKVVKRPTRGSLKPDDNGSSGKASPINTPVSAKRRRI